MVEPRPDDKKSEADALFDSQPGLQLAPKRPANEGDSSGVGGIGGGTGGSPDIDDSMEHSRKRTDVQTVIEKLFPNFPKDWMNKVLVSRVFPDIYNHLLMMGVKELVGSDASMSVVEATMYMNSVLSIPIDGESRIDAIHIIGQGVQLEAEKNKNAGVPM